MSRADTVRAVALYGVMGLVAAVWAIRRVTASEGVAALLATLWTLITLVVVHAAATVFHWWEFGPTRGAFLGMPIELYLAWATLWGAWAALMFPQGPLVFVAAFFLVIDLVLMPACWPAVVLHDHWLRGEIVAIVVCFLPAQLLARWTLQDRRLAARATLQVIAFATAMLVILPAMILEQTTSDGALTTTLAPRAGVMHHVVVDTPTVLAVGQRLEALNPWLLQFALQLLAIPAIVGVSAVCEFVQRGRGTPIPFDPPKQLVTSGPYAYVANPMQLSMALVLIGWGAMLASWWVSAAGVMAVIYSIGLAAWDEGQDLKARFGDPWIDYRRHVRPWLLRWRPFVRSDRPTARLYVASTCGQCSALGRWIAAHHPVGLTLVAAESHPTRDLWRLTYDPADGSSEEDGVAAVARALEHINLAWAIAGMTMRLPILRQVIQVIVDAAGGGPQRIARAGCELTGPGSSGPPS